MEENQNVIIRVVVPLFIAKALDYAWPEETIPPKLFSFVEVPVGNKKYHGMVVAVGENLSTGKLQEKPQKSFKLKYAKPLLGVPPLCAQTGKFYQWVSQYNFTYPGEGVRAALQGGHILERPAAEKFLMLGTNYMALAKTAAQKKVVHYLEGGAPALTTQTALARAVGVGTSVVKGLLDKGALIWQEETTQKELNPSQVKNAATHPAGTKKPTLNADQAMAAQQISAAVRGCAPVCTQGGGLESDSINKTATNKTPINKMAAGFVPFLLDGVTGSGKTEVYFEVIEDFLTDGAQKGQILILLPEIALTPQWLERFAERFGIMPYAWHSGVSAKNRQKAWWAALNGEKSIFVGARSALFLPFQALRLIVVDEEHDPSYKQEDNFRYHGRDMAVVRANLFKCPVVLASATPSLESWHNTQQGKYRHLILKSRYGASIQPDVHIIDLKKDKPKKADSFISPPLLEAIKTTLSKGQQALLFLNRRGYAPLLICRGCGHRATCPSCSAHMVVHGGYIQCHHCMFTEPLPDLCPKCHKEETLHPFGPGTRKIMKEIQTLLPKARALVVDRDNVKTPKDIAEVVTKMEAQQADILIGTQMLAKGHDFTNLTLVGVLDADMSLSHGDLRALERTYQLLTQVAGRAGRRAEKGTVFLQTHTPDHPVFSALQNFERDQFLNTELRARAQSGFPPFGRLVGVIITGPDEQETLHFSRHLAQKWPQEDGTLLLGPAPAPLYKRQDQYRFRLLLKTEGAPHALLQKWLLTVKLPKGVRMDVDVDPQSFF